MCNRKHVSCHLISFHIGLFYEVLIATLAEKTLRHLDTQQVAELDLRYVVGDVFLFLLCQFRVLGSHSI